MLHLGDLPPATACRVLAGVQSRLISSAVGDKVKPIAVASVLGYAMFVGRQDDFAFAAGQSLNFDKAEFTRPGIETGEVVTEVFLVYVGHGAARRPFVLHGDAHGGRLRLRIRAQVAQVGALAFRMWQDERRGESLDSFQVKSLLPFQFFSAALPTAA
jgi:hypothetical protein